MQVGEIKGLSYASRPGGMYGSVCMPSRSHTVLNSAADIDMQVRAVRVD